jgi:acetyl-CoA C-acetyltransferase
MQLPRAYLREGATHWSWADARRSLPELIFETVKDALQRSGLEIDDVDSVVLSAHDMVDGRSLTSMTTAPAAGAYLREEIRLGEDGAAALAVAAAQIQAGQATICIVAAWGRASEGDAGRISNALFDPFFAKPLGLTELDISALRASMALRSWPAYGGSRDEAARRRAQLAAARGTSAHGPRGPVPRPLREAEVAPAADVVCATVVTAEPTDVAVAGVGLSSEPYWPGDRDLLALPALRTAAQRALAVAGRHVDDVHIFELDGPTLFDEALALEAVGAARTGEGMRALAQDDRCNPSGGYAMGACAPAMGLVRAISAARSLRDFQTDGGQRPLALASGGSTVAGQTQVAVVLERC